MMTMTKPSWTEYRKTHPRMRIRDAAAELGLREVELLATGCGGSVSRLRPDWPALFADLPELGRVKTITRNENAVLERMGDYQVIDLFGRMGQALGDIDLRIFLSHWKSAFAVMEDGRHSIQFFDEQGDAIHKAYLGTEEGAALRFEHFVTRHRHEDQSPVETVAPRVLAQATRPDGEVAVAELREAWDALLDTHDFFGLLQRFNVSRTQALRIAGPERARRLDAAALRCVLDEASRTRLHIMIFVGNRGLLQIYTGPVDRIVPTGPWINVLDLEFNLHLREDRIDTAWLVRKPTRDGIVTSLELFDAAGETIAMLFGRRKPGQCEQPRWRELAAGLPATLQGEG